VFIASLDGKEKQSRPTVAALQEHLAGCPIHTSGEAIDCHGERGWPPLELKGYVGG
jgi:hypothetical protein